LLRNAVLNEETMRPGHWLSVLQCFETVDDMMHNQPTEISLCLSKGSFPEQLQEAQLEKLFNSVR